MAGAANEDKTPKSKQEYNREYYRKNRATLLEASKNYYVEHRERYAAQGKARWQRDRVRLLEQQRVWYQKNKEKVAARNKERNRTRRFTQRGLTEKDYMGMLAEQGGVCAICERKCDVDGEKMCIDHDHENGFVRGLLCKRCNAAIGFFREPRDILVAALHYLDLASERATK